MPTAATEPPAHSIESWQDAELNAAAWMRFWGFTDAIAKPGGSDGGIDVQASEACGQVKFQAAQVGRPAIQRLVGAAIHSNRTMLFFTGTSYARPAIEYANQSNVALFTYNPWGKMRPINRSAQRVLARTAQSPEVRVREGDAPVRERGPSPAALAQIAQHERKRRETREKWKTGFTLFSVFCFLAPFLALFVDREANYGGPWTEDLQSVGLYWVFGIGTALIARGINRGA